VLPKVASARSLREIWGKYGGVVSSFPSFPSRSRRVTSHSRHLFYRIAGAFSVRLLREIWGAKYGGLWGAMGGIDAVERIKNNMPDEFQRLPPGSFGTCIAKCVNNTEFVGASNCPSCGSNSQQGAISSEYTP
jgi:hypothetical protein